jgi:hypothetical protein
MANHKLTFLGHAARKKLQTYLQQDPTFHQTSRRFAYADGVMAISGRPGVQFAAELYQVDLSSDFLRQAFFARLSDLGFEPALSRSAELCAEAHLWMTLAARHSRQTQEKLPPRHRHPHPRHLHVWVYELDRKYGLKEDSPCPNCRQWVRREFATLNGT